MTNAPARLKSHLLRSTTICGAVAFGLSSVVPSASADSGNGCLTQFSPSCVIATPIINGSPASSPGFDKSGHNGNPGSSGGSLSQTFSNATVWRGANGISGIFMISAGGYGSDGTSASDGKFVTVQDLAGGDGGTAGSAGAVSVTIPSGSNAQVVSLGNGNQGAGILASSQGGAGGGGGVPTEGGHIGVSQPGGQPGSVTVSVANNLGIVDPQTNLTGGVIASSIGIFARSLGGSGGNGANHVLFDAKAGIDGAVTDANPGGSTNGIGGTVTVGVNTSVVSSGAPFLVSHFGLIPYAAGVWAVSAGGNGGNGGTGSDITVGGNGGNGGNAAGGGAIAITIGASGTVTTVAPQGQPAGSAASAPAIWAQSLGGIGGLSGNGSGFASGGNAGAGADGGTINITNDGMLTTNLAHSPGILAQSFGGAGPNGGTGGGFGASGGEGASGGNGGGMLILGNGSIATAGIDSPGILAQSAGGGGGNGGDSNGPFAVGGQGAQAGSGGIITVNIGYGISTVGQRSSAILAQSIGGGGGNGGDARGTGVGLNIVIGGTAGGGGDGNTVLVSSSNTFLSTAGAHSSGIVLQSIGGGGGNGGAAYSRDISGGAGASVSVGGNGGSGGSGGTIGLVNASQATNTSGSAIITTGADSFGIIGQSIGGGGGVGGASAATAKVYGVTEDLPTISLSVSLGGKGGAGGGGQSVTLTNSGFIATSGQGSAGMVGQSIGGGGGSGGDSSAAATAKGGDSPVTISSAISFGGNGGGAGTGGVVTLTNSGLIVTTGESADGILAQSIGGGGGNGGSGDAKARSGGDGTNLATALSLGGGSSSGGNSGPVAVTNTGAILTLGDGSSGVTAQAVGGGGGRGGGAAGTSNGTFGATVSLGGSGGSGGGSSSVVVTNSGPILTFGADAPGIIAQSVGGGGGIGGKGGSTLGSTKSTGDGGNGVAVGYSSFFPVGVNFVRYGLGSPTSYGTLAGLTALGNLALGNGVAAVRLGDTAGDAQGLVNLGQSAGNSGDGSNATNVTVSVRLGGTGGGGGGAGFVTVTNTGSIGTVGAMSDGILAQSVGGGGGKGGAAISSTPGNTPNSSLNVGGSGGNGGNGTTVTVLNDTGSSIITVGGLSAGIVAQSIAGGGGVGGTSGTKAGSSVLSIPITLGGNGGSGGSTGFVTATNNGSILTQSHNSIGILAQSITGGGGIVKTLSTDAADNGGGGISLLGGDYGLTFSFGGAKGSGTQSGGTDLAGGVAVNNIGSITTGGRNAYGILAQSIGGGGGVALGGKPQGPNFFGTGLMRGNAGSVTINLGSTSSITTTGAGAVGILAQSIGGGGGLAGDTGHTQQLVALNQFTNHVGNGGAISVTIGSDAAGGTVSTMGPNAPALLLQSIGGGGGRITNDNGAFNGSAGGTGTGGPVTVTVNGSVTAVGAASAGIYAESEGKGGTGAPITVTINGGATVTGGTDFITGDAAGVSINTGSTSSATPNVLTNNGTLTSQGGANGTAVFNAVGYLSVVNNGSMTGAVILDGRSSGGSGSCTGLDCPSGVGAVLNNGTLRSSTVRLGGGTLSNAGTFDVRDGAAGGRAVLAGDYRGLAGSTLRIGADVARGTSDQLAVTGRVVLDSTSQVQVDVASWQPGSVPVLSAAGGITGSPGQAVASGRQPYLFGLATSSDGTTLRVQTTSNLRAAAAGLSSNQAAVAGTLEQAWNTGGFASGTAALATVDGDRGYRAGLNSLAGASVGGVVAARQAASERFTDNLVNCEPYRGAGALLQEASCAWLRSAGSFTSLASSGDAPGYRQSAVTTQIGGQREVAPGWFVGASAGYETSWLRSGDDGSKVSGQSALFGLMVKRQSGPWLLDGVLDGGYGWYQSKRQVAVGSVAGQASGSPGVGHAGLHLRAAYQVDLGGEWYVRPSAAVSAIYRGASGYVEAGSTPFNLAVASSSDVVGTASPMLEAGRGTVLPGGAGTLRGFVGLGAAFYLNGDWDSRAQFAQAPAGTAAFTARTRQPAAAAKLNAGLDLFTLAGIDAKLSYGVALAPGYSAQSVVGRLALVF